MDKYDALIWGRILGIGNAVYADIAPGERFKFSVGPECRKNVDGTYNMRGTATNWQTGPYTAVVRIKQRVVS